MGFIYAIDTECGRNGIGTALSPGILPVSSLSCSERYEHAALVLISAASSDTEATDPSIIELYKRYPTPALIQCVFFHNMTEGLLEELISGKLPSRKRAMSNFDSVASNCV